jgi:UDP:flavonoid glycosyltransferase YjiC (YdhE family)
MPAAGHVNPTLPVVRELVARGEQVVYYDTEEFRSQIEEAGAPLRRTMSCCQWTASTAALLRSIDVLLAGYVSGQSSTWPRERQAGRIPENHRA